MPVSPEQVPFVVAKKWAKRLHKHLGELTQAPGLSDCQEGVARMLGHPHWHALARQTDTIAPHADAPLPALNAFTPHSLTLPSLDVLGSKDLEIALAVANAQGAQDFFIQLRKTQADWRIRQSDPGKPMGTSRWLQTSAEVTRSFFYTQMDDLMDFHEAAYVKIQGALTLDGEKCLATFQSFPVQGGADILLSVAKVKAERFSFYEMEQLGFTPDQVRNIEAWFPERNGLTLVLARKDQGAQATLRAAMNQLGRTDAKRHFPVRQFITDGVHLDELMNVGFSRLSPHDRNVALSMALKSVPDLLVVDEIRSADEMKKIIEAMSLGVRVWATVTLGSLITLSVRLNHLGLTGSPFDGSESPFLHSTIHQTLHGVVCPVCSLSVPGHPSRRMQNKPGCVQCVEGLVGRTVLAGVTGRHPLRHERTIQTRLDELRLEECMLIDQQVECGRLDPDEGMRLRAEVEG